MNLNDQGGDQFAIDHAHNLETHPGLRIERMNQLKGRYVIAMPGKASGHMTFLQDRRVSTGGYWTRYLSNARGFDTVEHANNTMRNLKYGTPRIALVDNHGNYRFIDGLN